MKRWGNACSRSRAAPLHESPRTFGGHTSLDRGKASYTRAGGRLDSVVVRLTTAAIPRVKLTPSRSLSTPSKPELQQPLVFEVRATTDARSERFEPATRRDHPPLGKPGQVGA